MHKHHHQEHHNEHQHDHHEHHPNENSCAHETAPDTSDANINEANTPDRLTEMAKKIEEFKNLYLRSQAELQNLQKRSQEEIKKARDYAIMSFAKDVVVVKDYLEMALKDESGNFTAIKTGVDLTLKQLIQTFERQYVKTIEPEMGGKLDPHLHQAVSTEEVEGQASNTIVKIMQKGYVLNDRVIRPAMVVVAK